MCGDGGDIRERATKRRLDADGRLARTITLRCAAYFRARETSQQPRQLQCVCVSESRRWSVIFLTLFSSGIPIPTGVLVTVHRRQGSSSSCVCFDPRGFWPLFVACSLSDESSLVYIPLWSVLFGASARRVAQDALVRDRRKRFLIVLICWCFSRVRKVSLESA